MGSNKFICSCGDCNCKYAKKSQITTIVCVVMVLLIFFAIITTCIQAATHANTTKTKHSETTVPPALPPRKIYGNQARSHVIPITNHNLNTYLLAKRFPYVAAVTRNSTSLWHFACFASVVLLKWLVTSAHCRLATASHRAILYNDYVLNRTYAFPIVYWRIHEKFNIKNPTPKYDIAVARLNLDYYPYINEITSAEFNESAPVDIEASVWKTVSTINGEMYLTNMFVKYNLNLVNPSKCFESYGVELDDSLFCVDTSDLNECFANEFGPLYSGDRLVGLLAVKPQDCDMRLTIFTNVSFYTNWVLKSTYEKL